jgi:hypothetical protein
LSPCPSTSWEKTKSRLADRYIPCLHAVGHIDAILNQDLWSQAYVQKGRTDLAEVQSQLAAALFELQGFEQLTAGRRPPELDAAIPPACNVISSLQQHGRLLDLVLSVGPKRHIADCPSTDALLELSGHLESFKKTTSYLHANHAERALGAAQSAIDASLRVPDIEIVRAAWALNQEFTAKRIRAALSLLQEQGLVDRWISPADGLRGQRPEYGLATRHVSDFVLASELVASTLSHIEQEVPVAFPPILRSRKAAAVLYAAALAERGHFLMDLGWSEPPEDLRWLHAESLALLPPETTAPRTAEIAGWLTESTALDRGLLRRLIVPISRIPNHPLGPRLLDQALRNLPLARRDPIWSVPEDLDGTGPWRRCFEPILDKFELSGRIDQWDGLPLVAAWTCSSVVENRRRRAREMLAVWGASRLTDMVQLLAHMSKVDDPQIVDDVVIAALGAAVGGAVDNPALKDLARLVDRLFFAEHATACTTSIPVRFGARGMVERVALVYPGEFDEELARARPPYAAMGDWPPIDAGETSQHSSVGGHVVSGDLNWYVAERCFQRFADSASRVHSYAYDGPQVDYRLSRAIDDGKLKAPPKFG